MFRRIFATRRRRIAVSLLAFLFLILAAFLIDEVYYSTWQAEYFSKFARQLTYKVEAGPAERPAFGAAGPYDERLGYSRLPVMISSAEQQGFKIKRQASLSEMHAFAIAKGLFPIYHEKDQAGLQLFDQYDNEFYFSFFPKLIYQKFEDIPDIIVNSLLFIENRELLKDNYPGRNPAVEWDRFAKAIVDVSLSKMTPGAHKVAGGSTLATQIEKFRHSVDGRTRSGGDKIQQMLSASIRAYLDGRDTLATRRRIALDYINSIPLSAIANYGEVNGLGDGLVAWYGGNFLAANKILRDCPQKPDKECAKNYKQILSLFVAQRRPSYYLVQKPERLEKLTNKYLKYLHEAGVITKELADLATDYPLIVRKVPQEVPDYSFVERKADNRVRTRLLDLLGIERLYEVDRLDLKVKTSLDLPLQKKISEILELMKSPAYVDKQGLRSEYLLSTSAPTDQIVYSFTLYERGENFNYLRVQTDNFNQPFNINSGVKLDLGSTAKLRTLITYLEVIAELYAKYSPMDAAKLKKVEVYKSDHLSRWAIDYLLENKKAELTPMLEAALERKYSASPGEIFFTGGGQHTFANFKKEDNSKVLPIKEALRHSVNLPFIRLMRDLANYFTYGDADGLATILQDSKHQRRQEYLARFADKEGKVFLRKFYRKYASMSEAKILDALFENVKHTPERYGAVLRAFDPLMEQAEFNQNLRKLLPGLKYTDEQLAAIYKRLTNSVQNLPDRGYIARIHPLEIWLANFMAKNPGASLEEVNTNSAEARQLVYNWLFNTRHKNAQDVRIKIMLEAEAFSKIHRHWKKLGYPFEYLVSSYATSIGSSGDRPAALAELMGIIVNNGVRKPMSLIRSMNFAENTPYETELVNRGGESKQVLLPEVASVIRKSLIDVVQNGTARRIKGVYDNIGGQNLEVGGKTGTGDHRFEVYAGGGRLVSSKVLNRTATFVFFIGDRFFGTLIGYVAGERAADYKFTSALPVQVLKILSPDIRQLLEQQAEAQKQVAEKTAPQKSAESKPAAQVTTAPQATATPEVKALKAPQVEAKSVKQSSAVASKKPTPKLSNSKVVSSPTVIPTPLREADKLKETQAFTSSR